MRTVLWTGIVLVAMVVLPLTSVPVARGQAAQPGLNVDSLLAAVQDSARAQGIRHEPKYTGGIKGNVSFVEMTNELKSTTTTGFGSRLSGTLSLDKKKYRLQDRSEEGKLLGASFNHSFNVITTFDLSFNDRRQFNRVAAVGGRLEDFVLNDQSITTGLQRGSNSRAVVRWDGRIGGTMIDSEKTFKTDDTQSGSVNGGLAYTVEVAGAIVTVGARGAYKQTWEDSKTISGIDVFELESFQREGVEDLGGSEDSVAARVQVRFNDSLSVTAEYTDYMGTRSYADQARGSLGSQLTGEENLIWEKETRKSNGIRVAFTARPIRGLSLDVDSRHGVVGADYATQTTRFSETTTDEIGAAMSYLARWGTRFTISLDRSEQFRDFGPQSVGSFEEIRKKFVIKGTHQITSRTLLDLGYDTQLAQSFYVDPTNPRDRDQLDNAVTARLSSEVWKNKVRVSIPATYTSTDFINIDQSQSSNNRRKTRYDFRPGIDFTVSSRFSVRQEYWLGLEFNDYDYRETDNSLDRTISFRNDFRYQLTEALATTMSYKLELHDRGSYLPIVPGGERFLEKEREDRRDQLLLGARYRINENLSAVIDYDYSEKVDRTVGSTNERITTDGGIQGGIVGRYNWGPGRELRLELKKANRFGEFNTDAQNDFWIMNSELTYAF